MEFYISTLFTYSKLKHIKLYRYRREAEDFAGVLNMVVATTDVPYSYM
jgi:hypothetical protein